MIFRILDVIAVPPGVKDVFVWLTGTPAPSDFCFFVCNANALTFLLTYLHPAHLMDCTFFIRVLYKGTH